MDHVVAGSRFRKNFYWAVQKYSMGLIDDNSMISYLGYLKNLDGKKLGKKMFDLAGFRYRF